MEENLENDEEKKTVITENKEIDTPSAEDKEEIKDEPSINNSNQSGESEQIKESEIKDEAIESNSNESKDEPEEVKNETPIIPKSKKGKKEGSWMPMIVVMGISLVIAFTWDKVSFIRDSVHKVLDPSAGWLLNWNLVLGMLAIVLIINIITTLIQKYATDQEALRELKKEQKILQEEMKKYKEDPARIAELSKKQMQFIPKTMKLTSRAIMFTGVPFILFFRWFTDVFTVMEATAGEPIRFFGFLSWFWFYLIFTMVFSSVLRKTFKVV